jgi:hypothetical protein
MLVSLFVELPMRMMQDLDPIFQILTNSFDKIKSTFCPKSL